MKAQIISVIFITLFTTACKKEVTEKNISLLCDTVHSKNKAALPDNNLGTIRLIKKSDSIQNNGIDEWYGYYEGHFLRLEGESGDPRGWARVTLNIHKDSVIFDIFSYVEKETFKLKFIKSDDKTIEFKAAPDESIQLIKKDRQNYILKSKYIDSRNAEKNEVKLSREE
ncbi:hypothetical protein [uncultured Chryseobacterium sp.]|uniref:hypothetical protein n=1 Tax=uncultured Chryseobacterium sp. TaxID=259322 RepID=UPI0025D21210|nr:hypothetical protein [uncultured Chryseobacterium sp.]